MFGIIRCRDDVEDKLVVVAAGEWTSNAIIAATHFQEQFFDSWLESG